MSRIVFIRDKTNKHSIRALLAAYEKWFPNREYYVVTPQDAVTFLNNDDTLAVINNSNFVIYKCYFKNNSKARPDF